MPHRGWPRVSLLRARQRDSTTAAPCRAPVPSVGTATATKAGLRCGCFRRYSCRGSSPRIRTTSPFFLLPGLLRRPPHDTVDVTSPLAQPLIPVAKTVHGRHEAPAPAPVSAGTITGGRRRLCITSIMAERLLRRMSVACVTTVGRLLRTEKVLASSTGMGSGIEEG